MGESYAFLYKMKKYHCEREMGKKKLNDSSLIGQISSRKGNILKLKTWKLILLKLSTLCNPWKVFPYSRLKDTTKKYPIAKMLSHALLHALST